MQHLVSHSTLIVFGIRGFYIYYNMFHVISPLFLIQSTVAKLKPFHHIYSVCLMKTQSCHSLVPTKLQLSNVGIPIKFLRVYRSMEFMPYVIKLKLHTNCIRLNTADAVHCLIILYNQEGCLKDCSHRCFAGQHC